MGVKDTNAITAMDGILHPVDNSDSPLSAKPAPQVQMGNDPKVRDNKATKPSTQEAQPLFRPRQRPEFPQLMVMDDSQRSAEVIRIRTSPFRIGRQAGDLVIPLDGLMSASHAEVYLKQSNGKLQWHLKDLDSTNGTFVRVTELLLKPSRCLLIGGTRYRFEAATIPTASPISVEHTQLPSARSPKAISGAPRLVPIDDFPGVTQIVLGMQDQWIGRDGKLCSVVVDDVMLSPRHVRIFCDAKGRWQAQCPDAINGLWSQIDEVTLDQSASFQCGEQRFRIQFA